MNWDFYQKNFPGKKCGVIFTNFNWKYKACDGSRGFVCKRPLRGQWNHILPFHPPLPWWEEEEVALKEQIRIEQMTYFLRLHYACAHILDGRLLIGNKRCNWRWLKRNYRTKSILDVAKVLRADHLLRASGSVLQEVSQSIIHFISQSNIRSVHKPCGRSVIPSRLISLQPTRAIINLSSFQRWVVVNRWLPYFEIHIADAYMYLTDYTCSRFDRPHRYKLKRRQRKSHGWRDKQEFVLS